MYKTLQRVINLKLLKRIMFFGLTELSKLKIKIKLLLTRFLTIL